MIFFENQMYLKKGGGEIKLKTLCNFHSKENEKN